MKLLPTFAQSHRDIEPLLNTINHCDCFELLARLPDKSVDMILADLPYGVTQAFYDTVIPLVPMWKELHRIIRPKGAIVLTASQPFSSMLVHSNVNNFCYEWIWNKRRKTNFLNAKKMPLTSHEVILIFADKLPNYYPQMIEGNWHKSGQSHDRGTILYGSFNVNFYLRDSYYPDTILEVPHDPELSVTYTHKPNKQKTHPNQKPVKLFEYLIKTYTRENEIVLDFVSGSGTTAIAARKCNRQFICGDFTLEYVLASRKRLQDTDPYRATELSNGQKQLSLFEETA